MDVPEVIEQEETHKAKKKAHTPCRPRHVLREPNKYTNMEIATE
jgi:hypothetical protein